MPDGRTRVKVCGLCSALDARAAVRAGADALGVVLAQSPRRVTLDEAAEILAGTPPLVARVGVFVDAPASDVGEAVHRLGLTAVQLHGEETPEYCAAMPVPVIKGFRVGGGYTPADVEPYRGSIAAVLLDTFVPGAAGGTGRSFVWDTALLPEGMPVLLAGGLRPDNAADAVRALHPFAVDVSSGVEERSRHKDHVRIDAFMAAVRAADEEDR